MTIEDLADIFYCVSTFVTNEIPIDAYRPENRLIVMCANLARSCPAKGALYLAKHLPDDITRPQFEFIMSRLRCDFNIDMATNMWDDALTYYGRFVELPTNDMTKTLCMLKNMDKGSLHRVMDQVQGFVSDFIKFLRVGSFDKLDFNSNIQFQALDMRSLSVIISAGDNHFKSVLELLITHDLANFYGSISVFENGELSDKIIRKLSQYLLVMISRGIKEYRDVYDALIKFGHIDLLFELFEKIPPTNIINLNESQLLCKLSDFDRPVWRLYNSRQSIMKIRKESPFDEDYRLINALKSFGRMAMARKIKLRPLSYVLLGMNDEPHIERANDIMDLLMTYRGQSTKPSKWIRPVIKNDTISSSIWRAIAANVQRLHPLDALCIYDQISQYLENRLCVEHRFSTFVDNGCANCYISNQVMLALISYCIDNQLLDGQE